MLSGLHPVLVQDVFAVFDFAVSAEFELGAGSEPVVDVVTFVALVATAESVDVAAAE